MDSLHVGGVHMIYELQYYFKNHAKLMSVITEFGSPATSFFFTLPLAFCISKDTGLLVAWAASLSEWLNGVLKWILHGERPYWWAIRNTKLVGPHLLLKQFPSTCETGPGSPSGHCMVTAATWYIVVTHFTRGKSRWVDMSLKISFFFAMSCIGISRCFIATHFPHQVIAGIMTGVILGMIISYSNLAAARSWEFIACAVGSFMASICFKHALEISNIDTNWSIELAKKYCAKSEWIHLDTYVIFALVRDSATLLGVGLALMLIKYLRFAESIKQQHYVQHLATLLLSVATGQIFQHRISLIGFSISQFLLLSAIKISALPVLVMMVIPLVTGRLIYSREEKEPVKASKLS